MTNTGRKKLSYLLSMILYMTIYGLSAILLSIEQKRNNKLIYFIAILIPAVFAALRYQVGTDYMNYVYMYRDSVQSSLGQFISSNKFGNEIGIYVVSNIAKYFGGIKIYFGLMAFLSAYFFTSGLKRCNKTVLVGIATFLFLATSYTTGFNTIRNVLAATIVFWGFHFIFENSFWKYVVTIVLAMLFHTTAIIALPLFFLWNPASKSIKMSWKTLLIIVAVIITCANFPGILSRVPIFNRFITYLNPNIDTANRNFLLLLIIYTAILLLRKWLVKKDEKNDYYILLVGIGVLMGLTGFFSPYIKRLALYCTICQPLLLAQIPTVFKEKDQRIVKVALILYTVFMFWLSYWYLGQAKILPYQLWP